MLLAGGCAPSDDGADTSRDDGSGLGVRGEPGSASPGPVAEPDAPASLPTFDPTTTVGTYAEGFPRDLLGAPDDATVLASSATPTDGRLTDVTLNLATSRSTQEAIDQLAGKLLDEGFDESPSAAFSGLTAQTTYTRTKKAEKPVTETVLLGVLDTGDQRLVTVSGSVLVPSD